jgi:IS5 family transposase
MAAVRTVNPTIREAGRRPPISLARLLRVYFLQGWFNHSDPAIGETLYDSAVVRCAIRIDLGVESAQGETTVRMFQHLLARNKLGESLLKAVDGPRRRNGMKITNGTIMDATIIGATSAPKNKDGKRDPAMHQTATLK